MKTLKHPACTVGWVARLRRSWLFPAKSTRITLARNPNQTIQSYNNNNNNDNKISLYTLVGWLTGKLLLIIVSISTNTPSIRYWWLIFREHQSLIPSSSHHRHHHNDHYHHQICLLTSFYQPVKTNPHYHFINKSSTYVLIISRRFISCCMYLLNPAARSRLANPLNLVVDDSSWPWTLST